MAEAAVSVGIRLEVLQSSLADIQKILNKLEPDTSSFKNLQKIFNDLTRQAEQFQIQTSKSFTSQRQFDQSIKTVEKLEDSLTRAQLAMDKIKFSDIKLDANQQTNFKSFETELANVEQRLAAIKEKVKQDILSDPNTRAQLFQLDKQGLNKTFDEIEKLVNTKTQALKGEIEGYRAQLNVLDERVSKGSRAKNLLENGITNELYGDKFFKQYANGSMGFKNGAMKQQFLDALQQEFQFSDADKDRLRQLTLGGMNDLFKNMNQGNTPNIFANWTKNLVGDTDSQSKISQRIQELEALQIAAQELKQKLEAAHADGTPLSAGMDAYAADVRRISDAIDAYKSKLLEGTVGNQQFANSFSTARGQLQSFVTQLNDASAGFLRLQQQQQTFNSIKMAIMNFMGFNQVLNLTKTAVRDAMNHIKELDSTMNGIAIVTNMSTEDLWKQVDAYSEMAQNYGTTIQGAYEVSKIYYQAGYETNDVLTLMNETLKMSKISGLDYATTTDYMMNALRGFKMEVQDAASVVDVYSALAQNTAVSQQELAEAMSKTASSMAGVGSTFEETSAMIATMVAVTRESANNIGSALKSIASRYGELTKDPTKLLDSEGEAMSFNKVDEALKSVGITLQTTDHQFRDFTDVITELADKWDTLDSAQQRYIATQFAGNRYIMLAIAWAA